MSVSPMRWEARSTDNWTARWRLSAMMSCRSASAPGPGTNQASCRQSVRRSVEAIPVWRLRGLDPCLPSCGQDSPIIRHQIGLLISLPPHKFGVFRAVPTENQSTGGQHLLQQWTMRLGEVDQVDRTSHGCGEFIDKLNACDDGEWCGCAHGEVEVAVRTPSSGGKRTEQDSHGHRGMALQDRDNGGPYRGIRFILAVYLSAESAHACSGITKPSAMQGKAGRVPPLAGHL